MIGMSLDAGFLVRQHCEGATSIIGLDRWERGLSNPGKGMHTPLEQSEHTGASRVR